MTEQNLVPDPDKRYQSFKDFYPFYLQEHQNRVCKQLHFTGSLLVLFVLVYILISRKWILFLLLPLIGYGFAWIGHFIFEKNKPATFIYPLYSLIGDWVMFKDILTGKVKF